MHAKRKAKIAATRGVDLRQFSMRPHNSTAANTSIGSSAHASSSAKSLLKYTTSSAYGLTAQQAAENIAAAGEKNRRASANMEIPPSVCANTMRRPGTALHGATNPSAAPSIHDRGG